ncbi:MAG: hypothetical protein AAF725_19115 [Acidobacteriota bacterium]
MDDPRPSRSFWSLASLAAFLLSTALLGGCATQAPPQHLTPMVPASRPSLDMAPPAARDALALGLEHLIADAPRTEVLIEGRPRGAELSARPRPGS